METVTVQIRMRCKQGHVWMQTKETRVEDLGIPTKPEEYIWQCHECGAFACKFAIRLEPIWYEWDIIQGVGMN